MSEPNVHWDDRTNPVFAEVAECFGIRTDLVMAAAVDPREPGTVRALVTPKAETEEVVGAVLRRDSEGVLQLVGIQEHPGFLEQLQERIQRAMDDELGEDE